jgi:hypothetical protein
VSAVVVDVLDVRLPRKHVPPSTTKKEHGGVERV